MKDDRMASMKFRFISNTDPEYSKELMLRWEVLNKPLGLPPGSELSPQEEDSLHLIALDGKKVVGCILFYPESETKGRLHQVALSETYQGKGFGRKMMATLEQKLNKKGIKEVYIYVPEEIEGFYLRLGYHVEGSPVERRGIIHHLMKKAI
jgi:ribosomal protein S18 acetylase RimI-like enzyme